MKCIELLSPRPDTWAAFDIAAKELIFNPAKAEPALSWHNAANLGCVQKTHWSCGNLLHDIKMMNCIVAVVNSRPVLLMTT